jgi:arsenical-resistance protein 2
MQDYLDDLARFGLGSASSSNTLKVCILTGGIKGWVRDFEGAFVDGFEEGYWEQFK